MKLNLIVAIFAIVAVPVCAKAQQASIAQLKECDPVVGIMGLSLAGGRSEV